MARGVNKVILIGNLGADPETRYAPRDGHCQRAARHHGQPAGQGNPASRSTGPSGTTSSSSAAWPRSCPEYLRKGSQVYVEGRLQTRKWQDRDGNDRYTTEIVADNMQMLGGRGGGGIGPAAWNGAAAASRPQKPSRPPSSKTTRSRSDCSRAGRWPAAH